MLASAWESLRNNLQEAHDLMARSIMGCSRYSSTTDYQNIRTSTRRSEIDWFSSSLSHKRKPRDLLFSGEEEDFAEGVLDYPPDTLPLAMHDDHGWVDDFGIEALCNDRVYHKVQQNVGISDPQVIKDIEQNTLHILVAATTPVPGKRTDRGWCTEWCRAEKRRHDEPHRYGACCRLSFVHPPCR